MESIKTEIKEKKMIYNILLIAVAVVWGTGFIATQIAIDAQMGASLILALRFSIASIILMIVCNKKLLNIEKNTLIVGGIAGILLFMAFYTQTVGQGLSTVSTSAFLTSTSVIMVPFIVWGITKKSPNYKIYLLAFMAMVGVGVLTLADGFSFKMGDFLVLLSAFLFATHIAFLGIKGSGHDVLKLTFIQMFVSAILSIIMFLFTDFSNTTLDIFLNGVGATFYLGAFPTCFCYYGQTKGQQHIKPSKSAIILSTEGLFGTIFSVMLGFEALRVNMVLGGFIILSAVILSEKFST